MLCNKHQVEEYYSSDCESCNLEIEIKQLEKALKIALNGWERCYTAYDRSVSNVPFAESIKILEKESDYQEAQKASEDKDG